MDEKKLLIVLMLLTLIPLVLLFLEKRQNERNLKKLRIRVNVNGIRGKSTITRMIFSILREAGYHVVGKTTGTAARMFYWNQKEEEELIRRPRGVSISEQILFSFVPIVPFLRYFCDSSFPAKTAYGFQRIFSSLQNMNRIIKPE